MRKISFGLVGAGWRANFYHTIASELSDMFEITVVVEAFQKRAQQVALDWGIPVVESVAAIPKDIKVDFLVLCLPQNILPGAIVEASEQNYFILSETFCADGQEQLLQFYGEVVNKHLVQFSEQYIHYPVHAARLNLIKEGILGSVSHAQVSVAHEYHGVSLLRNYLGINYESGSVWGKKFTAPITKGPDRAGNPKDEEIIQNDTKFAVFNFGDKWGVFEFNDEQYFSGIRRPRVLIRGERGEISNMTVRTLLDFKTPIEYELCRVGSGEHEHIGTPHNIGITAGSKWIYRNRFNGARLSDDEVAIATVLVKMGEYVAGGESFYPLEQGCQDQYLSILMEQAFLSDSTIEIKKQPWG